MGKFKIMLLKAPGRLVATVILLLTLLQPGNAQEMQLSSPVFTNGKPIPARQAYHNQNLNPALIIANVPGGTRALALIMDDPDAPGGTWNHWLVWNIAPDTRQIAEGETPAGAFVGRNDFGQIRYDGPAPPSGTHRYFFRLYALNQPLDLKTGASRQQLDAALKNHLLATATLMGTYASRP